MWALIGAVGIGVSLGLLGSGGSILTVPALVFLVGEPEKLAIAESLGIVGTIAGISAIEHLRRGNVDWRSVALVGPAAMAGSYGGAWGSQFVSGRAQLLLFAAVMLVAAYRMFASARRAQLKPKHRRPACLFGVGIALGLLSGMVGVGGGFLIVPALVLLGGLTMATAVGSSLVVICLSSLTGFIKQDHLLHVHGTALHWHVLALFIVIGALGSVAIQPVGRKLPQATLKQAYSIMVLLMSMDVWSL